MNNQGGQNNQNNNQKPQATPPRWLNYFIIFFLVTFLLNALGGMRGGSNRVQVEYSDFIALTEAGVIDMVELGDDTISFTLDAETGPEALAALAGEDAQADGAATLGAPTGDNVYYTGRVAEDAGLIDRLTDGGARFTKTVVTTNPLLSFMSSWIFPILIMYLIYFLFMRTMMKRMGGEGGIGGMMGGVGKSKAKVYNMETETGVTFADVAGQDEAKESLTEMVDFLHNPEKYQKIGAKQPKGALLVGPPGTGKTLLAKAVAGEAKVPFFSLSGSEFVEMFVGVGASRVRDLFQQAGKHAPCIVFIDEIDAIGKSRDNQMGGSNDEREQTLNQLLSEMDGFDSSKGIVVLAATNRPESLDKALLRPGRFDRRVIVDKPDLPGRKSILKVHAAKVSIGPDVDLDEIAMATSGATGADLANMVNEAALRAVRMGRRAVMQEDLMEAVEVVIAGKEKKDRILTEKEKRMVAFHEIGHALATALQKDGQPVQKITIVPRTMGALGYTMNMPEEERHLLTESELRAQIVTLLAGRAAEEVTFGQASTGASNDIERATKIARSMVTQYGMSKTFGMMGLESTQNQYLDGRNVLTCSDATGATIDEEVRRIIEGCHDEALRIVRKHEIKLRELAEFLVEKETITGAQFMEILKETEESVS